MCRTNMSSAARAAPYAARTWVYTAGLAKCSLLRRTLTRPAPNSRAIMCSHIVVNGVAAPAVKHGGKLRQRKMDSRAPANRIRYRAKTPLALTGLAMKQVAAKKVSPSVMRAASHSCQVAGAPAGGGHPAPGHALGPD